ncbi:MAG: tetratricopeptide repeat protein, partial [Proteobacteria bacterium]|nr:tetratricopeptide repeat protein [Pseudomonadota bacterium]
GINVGDVMIRDGDLFGDGVNVAARLEGLAEAGGVCISGSVFEQIKHKLSLGFEDMGPQEVKNIAEPVSAYRLVPGQVSVSAAATAAAKSSRVRHWRIPAMAAAAVVIIAAGGLTVWRPWEPGIEPASVENMAFPLPDKPSIAVLPFTNMSDDPAQEYFVDGMTEDLITDLSRVSGLFVIARNSTFVYKGRPVTVRQVAEDLGVRYVLEGSVRRAGDQVRINAQLIDATTGGHLWADRYDGSVADIFALQDKVTEMIVEALALNLTDSEQVEIARDETQNVDAREAFQIGWEHYLRFNPDDNAKAIPYFENAVELDPGYGRAYAALALVYLRGWAMNWHQQSEIRGTQARTRLYLRDAAIYPTSLASVAASQFHLYFGRNEDALAAAARALALSPNDPEAHLAMAWALIMTARAEDGVVSIQTAMRLNPRYTSHYSHALGVAHFALGQLDEAARVLEQALERNPLAIELAPPLAAAYARLGRRNEARAVLSKWEADATDPALAPTLVTNSMPFLYNVEPKRTWELFVDGVRLALLPQDLTIEVLADTLKNGNIRERRDAARNIGLFGPLAKDAVPVLIEALNDENLFVRKRAASALGKIGAVAKSAVPALKIALQEPTLRSRAEEALKRITGD